MEELVDDLRMGRKGKHYQGGNKTDMKRVRAPRYHLVRRINEYISMAIQFSRGCPFRCEFCDIIEIYGRVPRTKTPGQIFAELGELQALGFRGYVFLVDDNFIGNKKNAKSLLKELAVWNRENGYPFRFYTEASINLADDAELVEAMARANFFFVFIGIETPDPKLLKTTLKLQNLSGNPLEKLRKIREYGIHITAGFIVGFDGEERGVFEAQSSFIRASGIGVAMLGLLVAIPHTQLSRRLKKEGRLLNRIWDGQQTTDGINFIPKGEVTKREYLERYSNLVKEVFEPKAYFERILPALLTLRYRAPLRALMEVWRINLTTLPRLLYHLGVKSKATRSYFWKVFLRVAWQNPAAMEAFVWDCFYFHHLSQHSDYIEREISRYLAAPSPEDVLDEAVGLSTGLEPAIGLQPGPDLVA
ncbi:MAG: B12-binding domain-containing radical SAM protein [Deltaproteobacteria bacterium]|nr:B12-binding domain-containing radical SAM protein [Deltaproteobacteria bacterium]